MPEKSEKNGKFDGNKEEMNFLNVLPFVCLHLLRLKHTLCSKAEKAKANRKKRRKNCRQTKAIFVDEAEKP